MEKNEEIKKANSEYEILTGDAYERRIAYLREKATKDENTAIAGAKEEGIKEGIKENKLSFAKRMLEKNIDINVISEYTGLSEKEIKTL